MLAPAGTTTALATSRPPPGAIEVISQNAYRFQGWGTSLAWWANVVGGWQNSGQIMDALFGVPDQQHPDRLGLNVIRYNIGASPVLWCRVDEQPRQCTGDKLRGTSFPVADLSRVPSCRTFGPGRAVPTLADAPGGQPDIARDRNQLAVLRAVISRQARDSLMLEAFANSPPWWLTVSGCPQGNPNATDTRDNLAAADYGAYADFLAEVLLAFRQRGIVFDTLDPLNEPEKPWGQDNNPYINHPFCTAGCQEGMHFGPEPPPRPAPSLTALLDQVCMRLDAHQIGTRVSLPDGSNPSETSALLSVTGRWSTCLGQINTHMYSPRGRGGARRALSTEAQVLSMRLWMSEFGDGGSASSMSSALKYSSIIAADMRWLRPAAWVNWQAVEGSGGWGLFESPTWPREGPLIRTKRLSALEQYARVIRPGYQVLTTLDPLDDAVQERTGTMAAVDDLRHPGRIVIVGTNVRTAARHVVYDLAGLGWPGALTNGTVTRYRTTAAEDMDRLGSTPLRTTTLVDDQPPSSITTYVIDLPAASATAGSMPNGPRSA